MLFCHVPLLNLRLVRVSINNMVGWEVGFRATHTAEGNAFERTASHVSTNPVSVRMAACIPSRVDLTPDQEPSVQILHGTFRARKGLTPGVRARSLGGASPVKAGG
jgi:hypothetical protein